GHRIVADTIDVIGNTHGDLFDPGQHVEFGDKVVGVTVNHGSMPGHHGVIPAGTTRSAGVDTEFPTGGAQLFAHLVEKFGWEWAGTDAGGVGLDDTDGSSKSSRTDT